MAMNTIFTIGLTLLLTMGGQRTEGQLMDKVQAIAPAEKQTGERLLDEVRLQDGGRLTDKGLVKNEGLPGYRPSPEGLEARRGFQDDKFGIFIHWGVYSMLADGECIMHEKGIPYSDYSQLPAGFYPSRFSAAEWVAAVKDAGARYITITSRHVDGFAMFGSKASAYNIVDATPFRRDILKELADECQRQGIKLNLYYSLADWGREEYPVGVMGRECGKDPSKVDFDAYLDFMCAQLTELLTNYGPIGCIWLDCDWDHNDKPAPGEEPKITFDWHYDRIYSLIHSLQPACLIGNNHHRVSIPGEDIQIFERDVPGENAAGFGRTSFVNRELPLETCQTMNKSWGYCITDKAYKSADELIRLVVRTAGRNANLLLNVGPQPDGCIPAASLERMALMGEWLRRNGHTIYGTRATMLPPQEWGVLTHREGKVYLHVLDAPADGRIVLPFSLKARKVTQAENGNPLNFRKGRDSFCVMLPEGADCSRDFIIEIEL